MLKKRIVLIDEPLENDHRVLNSIEYDDPLIIDCSKYKYKIPSFYTLLLKNFFNLLFVVCNSFVFWIKFYKKYDFFPEGISGGLKTSLKNRYIINQTICILNKEYDDYTIDTIYANDLTCGLIGIGLSNNFGCKLIYDAHEVEFHRNRKNSFLRVVLDVIMENKVIKSADKIIVVNKPIKDLYKDIYKIPESKITIVDNNHFTPYIGYAFETFNKNNVEISIVYVGAGINGRKLESLATDSVDTEIKVYGFFLGKIPAVVNEYNWVLGSKKYLPELLELVKKKRLIMWCCTEDICLSYKLSLPNKFFQAIAIGIPIIAYKETYLAEIVLEYNLGYVYDDNNFKEIEKQLKDSRKYSKLLESVFVFQKRLFIEKIEL